MATKDINKAIIKEQFFRLGQIVKNAETLKNAFASQLAAVDALSKDYTPEYLAAKKQAVQNEYRAKNQALYTDAQTQLEKLSGALTEIHGSLDLNDPALTNAVSLIKSIGSDLSFEDKLKINASFAGNQPALKVLQVAYKAAGVAGDGGLDSQIYDSDRAVQTLNQFANAALTQDGSVFQFGVEIGKIAKLENVDFPQGNPFPSMVNEPSEIDLNRAADAARAAAGL
jgi:hypothetical protein